jgi:hypothetical protein
MYLEDGASLIMQNVIFDTNQAITDGGILYFIDRAGYSGYTNYIAI